MADQGTGYVQCFEEGPVLEFVLNNPQNGNVITGPMFDTMMNVLKQQTDDPHTRVLRIRANGDKFCLGRERAGQSFDEIQFEVERLVQFKQLLRELPLITIAEVEGDAAGFGFGMAILCDFTVVSTEAALYFPEIRFGLAPTAIMSYLAEYVPLRIAFNLVVTGEPITPERAEQIGLISAAVPRSHVRTYANGVVDRILQLDENGVRNCKMFFQKTLANDFHQNASLAIETLTVASLKLGEQSL